MIDLGIGLVLSSDEQHTIHKYKSINQTLSYPVNIPLFLDMVFEETTSERQLEVQLGVW